MRKLGRFLFWLGLIAVLLIGALRLTALRWWKVPLGDPYLEASIAPTLSGGDWVILWRLSAPRFGDLVLCPEPEAPERVVIGRLVGESGDRVQVQGSALSINGRRAGTEQTCKENKFSLIHPTTDRSIEQSCQIETLGSTSHKRGSTEGHGVLPAPVDENVRNGHVYLVSDNRLLPYDSRDFGQVKRETCKEMVVFRLVSDQGFMDVKSRFTFIH